VIEGNPTRVGIPGGKLTVLDPATVSPWRLCGAFYLACPDIEFLTEYSAFKERAGDRADSIGEFFCALAEDRPVRVVESGSRRDVNEFLDVGTPGGHQYAESVLGQNAIRAI
jgi:hypothetical protein